MLFVKKKKKIVDKKKKKKKKECLKLWQNNNISHQNRG